MPIISVSISSDNLQVLDELAGFLSGSRSSALRYILSQVSLNSGTSVSPLPSLVPKSSVDCGTKEIQISLPLRRDPVTGRFLKRGT